MKRIQPIQNNSQVPKTLMTEYYKKKKNNLLKNKEGLERRKLWVKTRIHNKNYKN